MLILLALVMPNKDHYGLTRVQYPNPVSWCSRLLHQSRILVVSGSSLTEIIYFFSLVAILFILLHSQRHLFHWLYRLLVDLSTLSKLAAGRGGIICPAYDRLSQFFDRHEPFELHFMHFSHL